MTVFARHFMSLYRTSAICLLLALAVCPRAERP